jgi:hypothetical protein
MSDINGKVKRYVCWYVRDSYTGSSYAQMKETNEHEAAKTYVLASDYELLEKRVAALTEALRKHGKHYIACSSEFPGPNSGHQVCNCGFSAALKDATP